MVGFMQSKQNLFRGLFLTVAIAFTSSSHWVARAHDLDLSHPDPLPELEAALSQGLWEEANNITRQFVIKTVFPTMHEPIQMENLTCGTFQAMDGMWRQYSHHQFGFSVQAEQVPLPSMYLVALHTYEEGFIDEAIEEDEFMINAWGDRLGWYSPVLIRDANFQWDLPSSFDWHLSNEITYNPTAPRGHLPWIGEDVSRIRSLYEADKPTCGVCAYDAVTLQHSRYYQYLRRPGWNDLDQHRKRGTVSFRSGKGKATSCFKQS